MTNEMCLSEDIYGRCFSIAVLVTLSFCILMWWAAPQPLYQMSFLSFPKTQLCVSPWWRDVAWHNFTERQRQAFPDQLASHAPQVLINYGCWESKEQISISSSPQKASLDTVSLIRGLERCRTRCPLRGALCFFRCGRADEVVLGALLLFYSLSAARTVDGLGCCSVEMYYMSCRGEFVRWRGLAPVHFEFLDLVSCCRSLRPQNPENKEKRKKALYWAVSPVQN